MKKNISIFISFILFTALLPLSGYTWPIPDSGQTKCYNDTVEIPCPSPGEDFYGQDGNYLINPPSYTKLDAAGNSLPDSATSWVMVRDNVTGLIWEVKTYDNYSYTWDSSNDFTDHLCVGDYCDWRLPTVKELASIINIVAYSPAIDNIYFPKTLSSGYWSSTIYTDNTSHAWYVNFTNGDEYDDVKSSIRYVRAVRSGQVRSSNSVIINNDGTVSDTCTGLMWQKYAGGSMTWKDSLSFCESLTLAGYSDWRLPTREELRSLVDYQKYNPAIDTSAFPDIFSSNYWSSTTYIDNTNDAWDVYFAYGDSYNYSKGSSRYVRAVRGGQIHLPDHLLITFPNQASFWNSGDLMPIKWDTQSISGNVKITLSRDGGKTFETITESSPNNGSYDWTVSGTPSVNCMLKIEPLTEPDKWTQQSLFSISEAEKKAKAIIVAGGGPFAGNFLWDATETVANHAYCTLLYQGYAREDVYYLSPEMTGNDIDAPASNSNLEYAVSNWAADASDLLIYMTDHGGDGTFRMNESEILNASDLDQWLDNLQTFMSGRIIFVYDAVRAGSFLPILTPDIGAEQERIIISSCSSTGSAYFLSNGYISFSYIFWSSIKNGDDLKTAFNSASDIMWEYQTAEIEADGDGIGGSAYDFNIGSGIYIGNGITGGSSSPTSPTLNNSIPSPNIWTSNNSPVISWNPGQDSDICGSGVAGYSYVFDTSASTVPDNTVETVLTQITGPALADGSSHYFHVRTVDNAGNGSTALHTGPFKIDTSPPTGTVIISNGAASTTSQSVTLTLSATDTVSGLSQMKFSNDNVNWSSPVTYSTSAAWTLTSGEGTKTVYARFSDAAGNWTAAAISDQITLAFSVTYPPNPEGLTRTSASDGKVSLKWDYISSPSGVTYNLYRSETENGIFYPINSEHIDISYLSYGKIVYADTVPDMEKTYFYKIRSMLNGAESQNFSNTVSASPVSPYHFECRLITDPSLMLNRGATVRFYFQLLPAQSFFGTLNLSCEGLPQGISYNFYTLGTAQGASLSGLIPPASVILEITAGTLTPTGDLPFTLLMQNVWNSGSSPFKKISLNLTVLPVNEEGIYAEVGETQIPFGTPAEIYGAILPPLSGRTVTLNLENLDTGSLLTRNLSTGTGGNFSDTLWISTLDRGTYEIRAQWRDDNSDLHISEFRYFTVEKGRPVLTCLRENSQLPSVDQDYTLSGKLKPALAYEAVKLLFFREGTRMSEYTVYTDGNGTYRITGSFFPQSGIWKVKAYWMGNDRYTGCESGFLELPVDTDSGRILMLAGGQAEQGNSYWDLTEKLTVRAYRDFKSCGYTNDMIWYMINSQMIDINYDKIPDPVVDDSVPSPDDFVHALETEYTAVLDSRTPLFVFLQGHGFRDEKFEVLNNVYLTASQIAGAINTLQTAAGCPVVFILESCYSGNFIPVLSGQNRVILTSAGDEIYNTDISGRISFSRYLFSKLREGDNLKKAFDTARKEMISLGYPSPLLDDNGDQKADTSDGLLASNIYLGGTLSWGLGPEIGEVTLPSLLAQGISTAFLSAEVMPGQADVKKVWAQIIPPDSDITGGDSTVIWKETELMYNPATGKYEGNLTGLYVSGIYKIILMAEDAEFETAEPKIEYIGAEGAVQPGDVNNDGKVNLADVIVVLQLLCNKQSGEISKEAAIGKDEKIGLKDAVFILRKTAGL